LLFSECHSSERSEIREKKEGQREEEEGGGELPNPKLLRLIKSNKFVTERKKKERQTTTILQN